MGKNLLAVLGGLALIALIVFLASVIGALFGALAGWATALLFPSMMAKLLALTPFVAPYQLGAALGFVGGFFKSTATNNSSK